MKLLLNYLKTAQELKSLIQTREESLVCHLFFWLRDEENVEDLSQISGKSPFHDVPFPDVPTFSDIKESDDETLDVSTF